MLYKFRKIFVLALCLTLVFGLCVTTFAADTFSENVDYSDGRTMVDVYADITRYTTHGILETTSLYDTSSLVEVTGIYEDYYRHEQIFSTSASGHGGSSVWVQYYPIDGDYSADTIFAMVEGNYYFGSTVSTYDGEDYYERWATVSFNPNN